jgi:hypothetical protein
MPTLGSGTATPVGPLHPSESIYLEGGPNLWIQDSDAAEANNPDSDGYYWGVSGSATYPIIEIGCYDDISLVDTRTSTEVKCAAAGIVATMQRRDSLELDFTLKSLFPLEDLRHIIGGGTVVHNATEETEKMGVGNLPQQDYYHLFLSRVYDEDTGDYISMTFHKVQFTEASPLAMPYGDVWNYTIKALVLADTSKPVAQRFYTAVRWDPSVL